MRITKAMVLGNHGLLYVNQIMKLSQEKETVFGCSKNILPFGETLDFKHRLSDQKAFPIKPPNYHIL